jgi:RsiW-degrading membrane proteinase PrsW (M82 family)
MNFFHLSILISVIIGIALIAKIRSYDIYEKETFAAMFFAFFTGGTASVVVALVLYELLGLAGIDDSMISTVAGSFLFIGPLEEFAKLAGLILVYLLIKKQFNEVTDGLVYISCVALGFSIIENFFYANSGPGTEHLIVFRAFISTPAHISFSCIIGYAWYRFKNENRPFSTVVIAFIIASVLHGIFDALAFSSYFRFLLFFYLWIIIHQSFKIMQYSNIISPFRPVFDDLFTVQEESLAPETVCPYCKSAAPKPKFVNRYFTAYRCDSCGYHMVSMKDLRNIFRHFAPEYKKFSRKIFPVNIAGKRYSGVYGSAFFEEGADFGFFMVEETSARLKLLNEAIVSGFMKAGPIPGKLLLKLIN